MSFRYQVLTAVALLAATGTLNAQGAAPPDRRQAIEERQKQLEERRQEIQKRREDLLQQRREAMQDRRGEMNQHRDELLSQRRDMLERLREMQQQLHERIASGQITKDQALEEIRAWRKAHRPSPPDGTRPPRPSSGNGG